MLHPTLGHMHVGNPDDDDNHIQRPSSPDDFFARGYPSCYHGRCPPSGQHNTAMRLRSILPNH